jgi:hypothetical protein
MAVVAGAGALLALAACSPPGADQSQAAPSSQETLTKQQLWDPCTLPDRVLAAVGVQAGTKDSMPSEMPNYIDWQGCAWHSATYFLSVFATVHTMAEFRANKTFEHVRDVTVGNRKAIDFDILSPPPNCSVALPTSKGTVQILIREAVGSNLSGNLCGLALRSANSLTPDLPY